MSLYLVTTIEAEIEFTDLTRSKSNREDFKKSVKKIRNHLLDSGSVLVCFRSAVVAIGYLSVLLHHMLLHLCHMQVMTFE